MKTNEGIIHYGSKADYMAKKPTIAKAANTSTGVKSLEDVPSKVDLSETAKEVAQKAKELPKKVESKAVSIPPLCSLTLISSEKFSIKLLESLL